MSSGFVGCTSYKALTRLSLIAIENINILESDITWTATCAGDSTAAAGGSAGGCWYAGRYWWCSGGGCDCSGGNDCAGDHGGEKHGRHKYQPKIKSQHKIEWWWWW